MQVILQEDAFQSALVNKNMAQKLFKEGEMEIVQQIAVNDAFTRAALSVEQAKNAYKTNLLILEEVIGMKIFNLMDRK
jgi:hypothetical protein